MKNMRSKKIILLSLLALSLMLVFGANAWKSNLKVTQIKVEGNLIVGTNEIVQLTQVQPGTLLYQADLTAIQRNVTSHYYIKDAVVERNLPNTISVDVSERVPIAIVNRTETLYVDDEGVVLPRSISKKLFDLPVISGIPPGEELALGSTIRDAQTRQALQMLMTMRSINHEMYYNISEIQVHTAGDIVLYAVENSVPIIFGIGDIADKFVKLEVFWAEYIKTRGARVLQYVDLRYKDQIVAKWNPEEKS
jgi:cell division protein FtsQ